MLELDVYGAFCDRENSIVTAGFPSRLNKLFSNNIQTIFLQVVRASIIFWYNEKIKQSCSCTA